MKSLRAFGEIPAFGCIDYACSNLINDAAGAMHTGITIADRLAEDPYGCKGFSASFNYYTGMNLVTKAAG